MGRLKDLQKSITKSQVWKSIFRVGIPTDNRKRALAMLGNVVLHLHPIKVKKSGLRMSYTWCMGGTAFFLFLVETITGLLLMFYYRPTVEYAYFDMVDLREAAAFGIMRELHRWGAHAMVIAVWLHMFRVFMTGSYKPPREFNWNVGGHLASPDPATVVHRLFVALGSVGNLGNYRGLQHGESHAVSRNGGSGRRPIGVGRHQIGACGQ